MPSVSLSLPASVVLALWLPRIASQLDARRAAHAVTGPNEPHQVDEHGAGAISGDLAGLLLALSPTAEVAAILPRPGDLMGAPAVRSADLLDAGEGVLVRRTTAGTERCTVLVPRREVYGSVLERGEVVTWSVDHDVADHVPAPSLLLAGVESLSHARREVQAALSDAVDALEALDVARERPDLADELLDLSVATVADHVLPPRTDPRQVDVLERAARVLRIVELATSDDGAAVNAWQAGRRAHALAGVERAARHAMAAASATRLRM